MEQFKCSRCKEYFKREEVIKYSKGGTKKKQYYHCNKCNTERMKKYRQTENGKEKIQKASTASIKKYQYKQNARFKVSWALQSGKIIKPNICEECLKEKIVEGHHFDYEKPLEVIWVCRKCHSLIHRKMI